MILVTGGTGFVGREVVRQLLAVGHRVRVLARRPQRAPQWMREGRCEVVAGDVLDAVSLIAAMEGADAVVNLVGILFETPRVSFEQAHSEATANVLTAACVTGVRRVVQMSALGTRADAKSRYHRTKWDAEELVRQSGLDWTILRPSLIYGAGDKSINVMASFLRAPLDFWNFYALPNLGGGVTRVQPVDVKAVAQAFVRALSNVSTIGKIYDVCGLQAMTWSELWLLLAERQGVTAILDVKATGFILRSALWTTAMGLPVFAAIFGWFGLLSLTAAVILLAIWAGVVATAAAWRTFLFYTVPWRYPMALAWLARNLLPRWMHFGEQLSMLAEDNVGDPAPAQQDLHVRFGSMREQWSPMTRWRL